MRQLKMTAQNTPSRLNLLVTWDIDGTLLTARGASGNSAHKQAIDDAVQSVHGINVRVNDVEHAGSTDRAIIKRMCLKGGIKPSDVNSKMRFVIEHANSNIHTLVHDMQHLVLPGVRQILTSLSNTGATLALTTGNLQSCAWSKLKAAGISSYFETGGFGCDCYHRTDILRTAIQRVTEIPNSVQLVKDQNGKFVNAFHVGDAVADMVAAREAGVRGIGVLTGAFSREQLQAEQPYAIFDDLSDTTAFLSLLGVEHDDASS